MQVRRLPTILLALLSSLAAAAASAQPNQNGRILLASVVDTRGTMLVDFGVDDFVVSDNGQPREVVDVHIADYPVVLLLDAGVDEATWATVKAAARRFITRIGERPVIVGSLASTGIVASFDDERGDVLEKLAGMPHDPTGASGTLAAIAAGATRLEATTSPFSSVIVVTARPIDATTLVRGELLPVLLRSGATVHVIEGRPAIVSDAAATGAPDLLKVLADQTHGQYTLIFSSASYPVALDRLADKLASEMMIQYVTPPGAESGDVKVGVRRAGARVIGLGVSK